MKEEKTNCDEIISPCKDICMMDVDDKYCIGCNRTKEERKNWWKYSVEEKKNIIEELKTR